MEKECHASFVSKSADPHNCKPKHKCIKVLIDVNDNGSWHIWSEFHLIIFRRHRTTWEISVFVHVKVLGLVGCGFRVYKRCDRIVLRTKRWFDEFIEDYLVEENMWSFRGLIGKTRLNLGLYERKRENFMKFWGCMNST